MKFCDYFLNWINLYKLNSVRKITYEKYLGSYNQLKKIAPDTEFESLTRLEYQNIIDKYAETHEYTTVRDFNTHLKACIKDAIEDDLLLKDPTRRVVLKGKKPKPKKIKYLSQFEAQLLIRSLNLKDKINLDYMILLLLKTGMRFSEALALTPADFDFENQLLTINKTLDYKKGESRGEFQPTKNKSSVRTITLDLMTMTRFSKLINDTPRNEPIFSRASPVGVLANSSLNTRLENRCDQAGINIISAHGLRHTHASILLANGVSVASISKRLGHSSIAITQKVYLHIIDELNNKDNASALAAMMNLGI